MNNATCLPAKVTSTDHKEARVDGLLPDTEYVYSVGGFTDTTLRFRSAPITGQLPDDNNIRIWIIGDSGTSSSTNEQGSNLHAGKAKAVMDSFSQFIAEGDKEPVDLFLLLGDNAYPDGTDAEWQVAVFDLYTDFLSQVSLWPTIGNHEMGTATVNDPVMGKIFKDGRSVTSDPNAYVSGENRSPTRMPYLDIFTLPSKGEVGGVASGTEQYYSFNFGNVHIVSLDSQLSTRDDRQRAAMRKWLIADLSTNTQAWTIVTVHHPPYTGGSHHSDSEPASKLNIDTPIIHLRQEFTALFEDYGVDLVYSGHSHSYERSFYLHGHRGDANTFDAGKHAELNSTGDPAAGNGDEAYHQISAGSQLDDKVVYTVVGSSGKVDLHGGKLNHPAHVMQKNDPEQRHGLEELGSVVLDVGADTLTARFINVHSQVLDTVVIHR